MLRPSSSSGDNVGKKISAGVVSESHEMDSTPECQVGKCSWARAVWKYPTNCFCMLSNSSRRGTYTDSSRTPKHRRIAGLGLVARHLTSHHISGASSLHLLVGDVVPIVSICLEGTLTTFCGKNVCVEEAPSNQHNGQAFAHTLATNFTAFR